MAYIKLGYRRWYAKNNFNAIDWGGQHQIRNNKKGGKQFKTKK